MMVDYLRAVIDVALAGRRVCSLLAGIALRCQMDGNGHDWTAILLDQEG